MDVGDSFADALRLNDAARAKALVSAEHWNRIDNWIGTHATVFSCPVEWRFWIKSFWDGETSWGVGGYSYADPTTANFSYGYQCFHGDPYTFTVKDIVLKLTAGEWLIVDWVKICETQGWQEFDNHLPCD